MLNIPKRFAGKLFEERQSLEVYTLQLPRNIIVFCLLLQNAIFLAPNKSKQFSNIEIPRLEIYFLVFALASLLPDKGSRTSVTDFVSG